MASSRKPRVIAQKFITHLFWDKYPYKVRTIYPAEKFVPVPVINSNTIGYASLFENSKRYRDVIRNFKNLCAMYLPLDENAWKVSESSQSLNYYFLHEQDADRFIAGNRDRISEYHKPESADIHNFMTQSKNELVRNSLFYNQYRYCITFRNNDGRYRELDAWVIDVLGKDYKRLHYCPFGPRKLYLNDEKDILLVQLAFLGNIIKIQKVILKEEISA